MNKINSDLNFDTLKLCFTINVKIANEQNDIKVARLKKLQENTFLAVNLMTGIVLPLRKRSGMGIVLSSCLPRLPYVCNGAVRVLMPFCYWLWFHMLIHVY